LTDGITRDYPVLEISSMTTRDPIRPASPAASFSEARSRVLDYSLLRFTPEPL